MLMDGLNFPRRPRPWTLVALAVVIVGATPITGSGWFTAFGCLGSAVLITLPSRWSIPAFVAVVGVMVVWSVHLPGVDSGSYRPGPLPFHSEPR
jgi:hypothetical protein